MAEESDQLLDPSYSTRPKSKPAGPDLISQILEFLSNASNETLGACLVGLVASTYFVLGRVGLLLIGAAGGIVLHSTWESSNEPGASEESKAAEFKRKRELGLDVVRRALDWREKEINPQDDEPPSPSPTRLDFADHQPATGAALSGLVDAVISDYVKYMLDTFYTRHLLTVVDGGTDLYFLPIIPFLLPVAKH